MTSAIRATLAFVFGAEPCHVRPWWNDPPPAFTTTGTTSSSAPSGAALRGRREPVVGRVELRALGGRLRPQVRAADVLDRPRVGCGLVQRDPAGEHLRPARGSRRTRSPGGSRSPSSRAASRARCPAGSGCRGSAPSCAPSRPVRSESTWAAITVSARQPLQIWRVRSSGSRPGTQFTSSGLIPVSYTPWNSGSYRSRSRSSARGETSPSSTIRKPSRSNASTSSSA